MLQTKPPAGQSTLLLPIAAALSSSPTVGETIKNLETSGVSALDDAPKLFQLDHFTVCSIAGLGKYPGSIVGGQDSPMFVDPGGVIRGLTAELRKIQGK
jgi:hypothetical protein